MSPNIRQRERKKKGLQNTVNSRNPGAKWTRQRCTQKKFPDKIETFQQAAETHICQASCSHVRLRVKNEDQGGKLHLQKAFIK